MNLPPVTSTRGASPRCPGCRHQGVLQPRAGQAPNPETPAGPERLQLGNPLSSRARCQCKHLMYNARRSSKSFKN